MKNKYAENRKIIRKINKRYGRSAYPFRLSASGGTWRAVLVTAFVMLAFFYVIGIMNPAIPISIPFVQTDDEPAAKPDADDTDTQAEAADTETDAARPYQGELELPVKGATGYAAVRLDVLAAPDGDAAGALQAGQGFVVLQEQGDWWEIRAGAVTGWVRHGLCMINLPDVIPSIRYNATNTYDSRFMASGSFVPGITGEALYEGKAYNERLQKTEYLMPVMYAMAKKVCRVQRQALAQGDSLVLYEGFRPYAVQQRVAQAMQRLSGTVSAVNRGINTGSWSLTWFISTGVSNHQRGCAVDVSLIKLTDEAYGYAGGYTYRQAAAFDYYAMPSPMHELSVEAATFRYPVDSGSPTAWERVPLSPGMENSPGALRLQAYCVEAGLTPLASEWWHFNDLQALADAPGGPRGQFTITDCFSETP